jgi:hypothetical protein
MRGCSSGRREPSKDGEHRAIALPAFLVRGLEGVLRGRTDALPVLKGANTATHPRDSVFRNGTSPVVTSRLSIALSMPFDAFIAQQSDLDEASRGPGRAGRSSRFAAADSGPVDLIRGLRRRHLFVGTGTGAFEGPQQGVRPQRGARGARSKSLGDRAAAARCRTVWPL